jgi:hypothetical protein
VSKRLARFTPLYGPQGHHNDRERNLSVTAFVANQEHGCGVQFTIGDHYCRLGEHQIRTLIKILEARLASLPGYRATDATPRKILIDQTGQPYREAE